MDVDITRPLVEEVNIEVEGGQEFKQGVKFEGAPLYYQQCCAIGHVCQDRKRYVKKWVPKAQQKPVESHVVSEVVVGSMINHTPVIVPQINDVTPEVVVEPVGLDSSLGWQAATKVAMRSSFRKLDLSVGNRGFAVLINEDLEALDEVRGWVSLGSKDEYYYPEL